MCSYTELSLKIYVFESTEFNNHRITTPEYCLKWLFLNLTNMIYNKKKHTLEKHEFSNMQTACIRNKQPNMEK